MVLKSLSLLTLGKTALHNCCSGQPGDRASTQWHWGSLCMFTVQVSWWTNLWVNMILLLRRLSWKVCSLLTVGKTLFCTFIIQVIQETELQVSDIGEVSACSLFRSPGRQSFESIWWFYSKHVLEKAICWWHLEISAMHDHSSGLWGSRAHWAGVVVLKGLIIHSFHFRRVWWLWNDCFTTISTLRGLRWTWKVWLWKYLLQEGVMVLKTLNIGNLHFRWVWWPWNVWFVTISSSMV